MLAYAQNQAGQTQEAIKNYRTALKLGANDPLVMNNLAYALADSGADLDEAAQLARDSQLRKPTDPNLQDTLGWVYTKQHLYESAIQIFRSLAEKYPENFAYRYHLAVALAGKGDRRAAMDLLQNALSAGASGIEEIEMRQFLAQLTVGSSSPAKN